MAAGEEIVGSVVLTRRGKRDLFFVLQAPCGCAEGCATEGWVCCSLVASSPWASAPEAVQGLSG